MTSPLVLGVGNVLLGDEGVGVHAALLLAEEGAPEGVTVVDGGTGGFHLLELLQVHDPVVVVDATLDGRPAGTVEVRVPRHASDFPRCLSAHDIGLRDLFECASLLGPLPRLVLVTVSVEELQPMELKLSPAVEAALPEALRAVREALRPQRSAGSQPPLGPKKNTHTARSSEKASKRCSTPAGTRSTSPGPKGTTEGPFLNMPSPDTTT